MEREGRKRQKPTDEMEAPEAKSLCYDWDWEIDHVLKEIASEMDTNDLDSFTEKVENDLVRDMMKSFQQEIMSSSSCEYESSTSSETHETAVNGESGSLLAEGSVECNTCNVEFEYLWGTGDEALRIMTSREYDFVESVNDERFCGWDYNPDYGFFECLQIE